LAVVLRGSPERGDPSTVLKPVQGRIEGSVLDLQHVFGAALDRVCDGLAVSRSEDERLEDQHVQGALDHFGLERRLTSWHFTCRSSTRRGWPFYSRNARVDRCVL